MDNLNAPYTLSELPLHEMELVLTFRALCAWIDNGGVQYQLPETIKHDFLTDMVEMLLEGCSALQIIHYLKRNYLKELSRE
jgi:hypothetical protein